MQIEWQVFSGSDALQATRNYWQDLEAVCAPNSFGISSSWQWCSAWWENIGANKQNLLPFIVVGFQDGHPVALAPFVLNTYKKLVFKVTFLEWWGQQFGGLECSLICPQNFGATWVSLLAFLKASSAYDAIFLKYIRDNWFAGNETLYAYAGCPATEVNGMTFDEYRRSRYGKSLKQNIRTALNRATKDARPISIKVLGYSDPSIFDLVSEISKSKLEDGKQWLYGDPQGRAFYATLAQRFDAQFVVIYAGGVACAYRFNLIWGGIKYCLDASFLRDFKHYELGALSVQANLEDTFSRRLLEENFGPGLDYYKTKFHNQIHDLFIYLSRSSKLSSPIPLFALRKMVEKREMQYLREKEKVEYKKDKSARV